MTKHDLKEMRNLGAELGAAKAENDRLRGLLEAALYYVPSNKTELRTLIDTALSQQAEPVEQATAQDERENWNVALLQVAVVLEALRSEDSAARLANMNAGKVLGEAYAKLKDLRASRRAQTEQQPEQRGYLPLSLTELLQRYKRDLELRTFPDNDEGDYQLRWTAKEIARVNAALSSQGGEA